jgi:aspartyl protease family protein
MMRYILIFAALALAIGGALARYADQLRPGQTGSSVMSASAAPHPGPAAGRSVTLQSNKGHFQVEARVDGRSVDFLVDTGASMIALRESAAAKLGVRPSARDYTVKIQTANGLGKAARVRLNRVDVSGITVRDVEAFVMPDEALSVNLLGMSFLSRIKWTHDRGRLVLEQ